MKNSIRFFCGFILFALLTGCSTIYGVAVEERSVGTIAADTKIKASILAGFAEDEEVKILDLSPYCYEGNVYLVGEYAQDNQRDRAIEIARGTEGVKSVTPYILAKVENDSCGTSDNLSILAKVKAKLIGDKTIFSTNIDIKVVQCHVVLLGIVKSPNEIEKAIDHAKAVEGVRDVKSFLKTVR